MRLFRFLCIVVAVLVATSFSGCGRRIDKNALRDLGGVYSTSMNDLDLTEEISGRLSSDETVDLQSASQAYALETSASPQNYNKVLRWGIRRNTNNQLPDADPGAPDLLKKYGSLYLGDTSKKVIYLTFDEGYENGYTEKILDVLRDNNCKAVFFITGPYLKEQQALVRRMVDEGHIVGNHTIHHPSLPSCSDDKLEEELVGLDRAFNEKFGKNMKYLRPPKGEYSERTLEISKKLGYCNLFWSFAYDDWYRDKIRGPKYAYDMVMKNLHNGAIILLHAVSKDNADALDSIIKGAHERGYEIGNVDDIAAKP